MEKFLVIYFDDILIYRHFREQYLDHLWQVCTVLRKEELYASPKCAFLATQIHFLSFIVSSNRVSADPKKVSNWGMAKTKDHPEIRSFHGLSTFHRRFIKGLNIIIASITDCLKKGEFAWSNAAAKAFVEIKTRMISAPVMRLPDFF